MKKVLLTGATGYLGGYVLQKLLDAGHSVVCLHQSKPDRKDFSGVSNHVNCKHVVTDSSPDDIYNKVLLEAPEVAVHLAAISRGGDAPSMIGKMVQANILLPSLIAKAVLDSKGKGIILCGSSWQNAGSSEEFVPFDYYAATKEAAENLVRAYVLQGLKCISLRLFDVYGPGDTRKKIVDLVMDAAISGNQLAMSPGMQKVNLVYVDDVANAFVQSVEQLYSESGQSFDVYGVSGQEVVPLKEIVEMMAEITGVTPPILWGGRAYRSREIMEPPGFYKALPKWKPQVGLAEGLKIVWDKKHGR